MEKGEIEQIFAYILIALTFVIILKRFNWEEIILQNVNAVHHPKSTQEVHVQEVFNPFHIAFSSQFKSSIKDDLNLQLSLVKPAFVSLFWGAEIDEFYKEIQHPWQVLHGRIQEGLFLGEKKMGNTNYLEKSQICENSEWQIEIPVNVKQHSEASPRKTYPAVVACTLEEPLTEDLQIVIMLSVLHIKDTQVRLDSQVLFQYLITNEDKVTTLHPYYVSTESSSAETERRCYSDPQFQQSTSGNSEEQVTDPVDVDSCCVCQSAEMMIVLLPCRHGCVCSTCVNKLDKCPVCREVFTSYFRIKKHNRQEFVKEEQNSEHIANPRTIATNSWWERFNEKLNSFFGFT
ncbi:cell growth regulator with RING finger domain protein 1-like isoform X2 [Ostrea edulis]|uniref:cell growth regulator with RING finger domain protein 1-like isoform X2 n=1 Tax=Ostrea edulis TaxID=37623 RepID=UPI0024AF6608|nr:cell growth regulator with RING finger domain protein 1-like isoform X2 [Ostrea edulis]